MTSESYKNLRAELTRDEGDQLSVYTDTEGNLTVGVGHNLTANGISPGVRDLMLTEDIGRAQDGVKIFAWFVDLNEVRQRVILNMVFNMGAEKVSEFHLMIAAIINKNYYEASKEMLDSKWAKQVGARAMWLAHMFLTGCEPGTKL